MHKQRNAYPILIIIDCNIKHLNILVFNLVNKRENVQGNKIIHSLRVLNSPDKL